MCAVVYVCAYPRTIIYIILLLPIIQYLLFFIYNFRFEDKAAKNPSDPSLYSYNPCYSYVYPPEGVSMACSKDAAVSASNIVLDILCNTAKGKVTANWRNN